MDAPPARPAGLNFATRFGSLRMESKSSQVRSSSLR